MYISCTLPESFEISTEVGIYKRKQESHNKGKHTKKKSRTIRVKKKERKHALDQESKKKKQ